ncbi:hypothetical protein [Streptomyces mirabilis]
MAGRRIRAGRPGEGPLAAITRQDVRDVLDLAPGWPARTAQQYLRSIF